jgi:hypothetical protein
MQNQTKLTDDKIVTIAQETDKFMLDIGMLTEANGIELCSIILGRLMIFANQVGCYNTFQELLETVSKMKEPNLNKTEDLKEE